MLRYKLITRLIPSNLIKKKEKKKQRTHGRKREREEKNDELGLSFSNEMKISINWTHQEMMLENGGKKSKANVGGVSTWRRQKCKCWA